MTDRFHLSGLGKLRRRMALASARLMRLKDEEKGATAAEFAMLAIPFLVMILSLLELAFVFLVYTTLDNAMSIATRTIWTGTLQNGGTPTASAFVTQICNNMGWLQSSCAGQLQVDVRTETQFANPTEPDPMQTGTFNPSVLTFNPGTASQIVLVRAFYQWPLILPVIDAALSRGNNGVAVIVSTTAFVNEPYQ